MPLSDVELCSNALIKIGAQPIGSFSDPTLEAEVARKLYTPTLEALLTAHPWTFSIEQTRPTPAEEAPLADFAHAFELPADFLNAISVGAGRRGRGIAYRIVGRLLAAPIPDVVLTYQRRPAENQLSPHFAQALVTRLAAEFCIPLTEGTGRAETLYRMAQNELQIARLVDSQQATPRAVEDFTLIQARAQ